MEKRETNRIKFDTDAEITYKGKTIGVDIDNMSLKGMFVITNQKIPANADIEAKIRLTGSSTDLTIHLKGLVKRVDENGVAVEFKEMELDSFIHLKNIITYSDIDSKKANELT